MEEFEFLGKTFVAVEDLGVDCYYGKCYFINRDCETLQECGEIPQCMSFYRNDIKNIAFIEKIVGDGK